MLLTHHQPRRQLVDLADAAWSREACATGSTSGPITQLGGLQRRSLTPDATHTARRCHHLSSSQCRRKPPETDTPHGLTPDGFSVQRPGQRRDSPQALSAPVDVSRRVLIAVHHQSAGGADMGAHGE